METIEAIKKRRSIRKYDSISVKKDNIISILDAGRLAPSAKNRQPWFFVVLNKKLKDTIGDLMINIRQKEDVLGDYTYSNSINFTGEVVKNAPSMILIFSNIEDNYFVSDVLSVGAAIENMILRATDLGYGSLWIRDITHIEKEICDLVNISDKKLISALLIGKPLQNPHQRPRKELDDITIWL